MRRSRGEADRGGPGVVDGEGHPIGAVAVVAVLQRRAVGAGGIGFYITQAIQEFQFNVMMTYVLKVMVMVIALDMLSAWLRRRIGAVRCAAARQFSRQLSRQISR
jgi:ABC-type nitrate/sulfonate/bicarbonate transport system permease component